MLTRTFLVTVLAYEPYRSTIPPRGVRIRGAYFRDGADLADANIRRPLSLQASRFERGVDLSRLSTSTFVSLHGSTFIAPLHLDSASIGGDLIMTHAQFASVTMSGGHIGGDHSLNGSAFRGQLVMKSVRIAGDLTMRETPRFQKVLLRGTQVDGRLAIKDARFDDLLDFDSGSIGRDLIVRGETVFSEVALRAAQIGDQLDMVRSEFTGPLRLDGTKVAGSVLLGQTRHHEPTVLRFVEVGRNLDVRGAQLHSVDLTGARIRRELRLGDDARPRIAWIGDQSQLILRNVTVGGVVDKDDSWPTDVELDGFEYGRLHRIGDNASENRGHSSDGWLCWCGRNDEGWFEEWLGRDTTYSPQPYQRLASVLQAAGLEERSYDILVANRDAELKNARWTDASWWKLWALWLAVGYGYGLRPLRWALCWSVLLIIVGMCVLRCADAKGKGFWYCVDMLLPVVRLDESHYTTGFQQLPRYARYYFYGHQVGGYALGIFVVAGLTGLTE